MEKYDDYGYGLDEYYCDICGDVAEYNIYGNLARYKYTNDNTQRQDYCDKCCRKLLNEYIKSNYSIDEAIKMFDLSDCFKYINKMGIRCNKCGKESYYKFIDDLCREYNRCDDCTWKLILDFMYDENWANGVIEKIGFEYRVLDV